MAILNSTYGMLVGGVSKVKNLVVKSIVPVTGIYIVDEAGNIGMDVTNYFQTRGAVFNYNWCLVAEGLDYSQAGLGTVTFYEMAGNVIGGREYRTVIIGGKEWLAENLDFKFSDLVFGRSGTSSTEPRGNYYQNNSSSYGKYGILYNWIAVKYLEDNKSYLIPGWHVPTNAEWNALVTAVGGASVAGTKLKSTTDWSSGAGTDDYGFSLLPAGVYGGSFDGLGTRSSFWTPESAGDYALFRGFNTGAGTFSDNYYKYDQYSVRLVKDSN